MARYLYLLFFVLILLPTENSTAKPVTDEAVKTELHASENKQATRKRVKRVKRVIMTNKVIEYRKTFYIT